VRPAWIAGAGLWAPGFRDASAWLAGAADPAVTSPPGELLPAALRRRASLLARLAAEVAAQAAREAGADLSGIPVVLGSAHGEIGAAIEMIGSFREGEGLPSPTRFHNSVHNAPAAYLSIATRNRGFSTALAAGRETPAMALLEAGALLDERGGDVLVLLADEPAPEPFAGATGHPPAGLALVLSATARPEARARLSGLRRAEGADPRLPGPLAAHPCAGGFALLAAAARGARGPVPIAPGWTVDVEARNHP
jgi:hypothetical protein